MRWYWKCLLDGGKAMVPMHAQVRRWKHRLRGYQTDPLNDRDTIEQGLRQIAWIQSIHPVRGSTLLEVGTGWKPTIPILFSLAGAERVLLTDLRPLCSNATLTATIATLKQERKLILGSLPLSESEFDEALSADPARSFRERMGHLRLEYLAPCDCQAMKLPSASVDLVISRAVLEHIPPAVIQGIFRESFRLLREGGVACHIIDNSDHWEHSDKTLSRLNFLRFSEAVFRWTYWNGLNYQNRLRHSQYIDFLNAAGFSILAEEGPVDPAALSSLQNIPLAAPFRKFTPEDLAILTTSVLALKPVVSGASQRSALSGVKDSRE